MLNLGVKIYLDKFDRQQKPLESYCGERAIATEIKTILDKHTDRKSDEDIAECIAFDFGDLKGGKEVSCWGTYYGPAMTWSERWERLRSAEYSTSKRDNVGILAQTGKGKQESDSGFEVC